jgi:hypothetical protein
MESYLRRKTMRICFEPGGDAQAQISHGRATILSATRLVGTASVSAAGFDSLAGASGDLMTHVNASLKASRHMTDRDVVAYWQLRRK